MEPATRFVDMDELVDFNPACDDEHKELIRKAADSIRQLRKFDAIAKSVMQVHATIACVFQCRLSSEQAAYNRHEAYEEKETDESHIPRCMQSNGGDSSTDDEDIAFDDIDHSKLKGSVKRCRRALMIA
jgi:hypothetical protein